jgi:hypothetical protein
MAPREKPTRWQWLRKYRIWEANRKVFLYPENSLEPEPAKGAAKGDAKRDEIARKPTDDES